MPEIVAQLRDIELTYAGPPPVAAVRGCDLTVHTGEFVAITGASGSGKSSLLNIIGLLDEPTGGTYTLDGVDVSHLSDRERAGARARSIGFVFQAFHLIDHRTLTENVAIGLLYARVGRRERAIRAREVLDLVGLTHRANAVPATLSGGERQRTAIARALVGRPALLLCDEPTGNLDTANTRAVLDLLGDLHTEGVTIIVVTHDDQVAARADRILRMTDGLLDAPRTPVTQPSDVGQRT